MPSIFSPASPTRKMTGKVLSKQPPRPIAPPGATGHPGLITGGWRRPRPTSRPSVPPSPKCRHSTNRNSSRCPRWRSTQRTTIGSIPTHLTNYRQTNPNPSANSLHSPEDGAAVGTYQQNRPRMLSLDSMPATGPRATKVASPPPIKRRATGARESAATASIRSIISLPGMGRPNMSI